MSDLQTIRELTVYALANTADVALPDSETSAGAEFLDSVRTSVLEHIEYLTDNGRTPTEALDDMEGRTSEIADSAVPVYTHQRWQTFVDLAAWMEDLDDLGGGDGGDDMTAQAGLTLYMIAERLVGALMDNLREWADEMDESTDEEDEARAMSEMVEPFVCAECSTSDATTYVVTGAVDDREGRTEVCLPCHDVIR